MESFGSNSGPPYTPLNSRQLAFVVEELMRDQALYPADAATDERVKSETTLWIDKAVVGLNLCPFARAPIQQRLVRYVVTGTTHADQLLEELEHEALALAAAKPSELETVLLIVPHLMANFLDFHFFLDEANALLKRLGLTGVLQLASFHPRFEFAGSNTNDVTNYTNRSPYPILHLLREDSVSKAVSSIGDVSAVTRRNIETLNKLGHHGWIELWNKP